MKKFSLCLLVIGLIFVQIESFQHGFLNRYVRSPGHGPPKTNWNDCCNVELTEDEKAIMIKEMEGLKTCRDELYGTKDEEAPRHAAVCVIECWAKQAKFFENDKLNDDAFIAWVKKVSEQTERLNGIAEEIATKCLEKAKDTSTDRPTSDGMKCSQQPIKAAMCVGKEFAKSCPAADQDQSERCVRFRERLEKDKPEGDGPEEKKE